MSADDEFADLCDKLIADNKTDPQVENAVIELEVAHKKAINAVKRRFNAELEIFEKDIEKKRQEYDKFREEDREQYKKDLAKIETDYKKQMEMARLKHQEDIRRVKDNYESILESKQQTGGVVARVQEDHRKELERVKEEYERLLAVKESENAALKRRIDEDIDAAENMAQDLELRRRLSEDEVTAMRREMSTAQAEQAQILSEYREMIIMYATQLEKQNRQFKVIINSFQDRSDEAHLQLSKFKQAMYEPIFTELRAKLGDATYTPTAAEVNKAIDAALKRRETEQKQIDAFSESTKNSRKSLEEAFEKQLKENVAQYDTLQKKHKETDENTDNKIQMSRQRSASNYRDPNAANGNGASGDLTYSTTAPARQFTPQSRRGSRLNEYRAFTGGVSSRRGSMTNSKRENSLSGSMNNSPEPKTTTV